MERRSCLQTVQYPVFSEQLLPVSLLCFTQLSIGVRFSGAHNETRIDDAVRDILANKLKPDDFPMLEVFHYEGFIWSLNNRRLWVFKKARVSVVTVRIVSQDLHKKRFGSFLQDLTNRPELLSCMSKTDYFPKVRGKCQLFFKVPRSNSTHVSVVSASVPLPSKVQDGSRLRLDQKVLNALYPVHSEQSFHISRLCFTQTSIGVHFSGAHQHFRIDDAVLQILANKLKPDDFPTLEVILYEGLIWSLNNRRLWVFRKAGIADVTVRIVPQNLHKKRFGSFQQELDSQPDLLNRMARYNFFPQVRGKCQKVFITRATVCIPSKVQDVGRLPDSSILQKTPVASLSSPKPVKNIWAAVPAPSKELDGSCLPDNVKIQRTPVSSLSNPKPVQKIWAAAPTPSKVQDGTHFPEINRKFQTTPVSSVPSPNPVNKNGGRSLPCLYEDDSAATKPLLCNYVTAESRPRLDHQDSKHQTNSTRIVSDRPRVSNINDVGATGSKMQRGSYSELRYPCDGMPPTTRPRSWAREASVEGRKTLVERIGRFLFGCLTSCFCVD